MKLEWLKAGNSKCWKEAKELVEAEAQSAEQNIEVGYYIEKSTILILTLSKKLLIK